MLVEIYDINAIFNISANFAQGLLALASFILCFLLTWNVCLFSSLIKSIGKGETILDAAGID